MSAEVTMVDEAGFHCKPVSDTFCSSACYKMPFETAADGRRFSVKLRNNLSQCFSSDISKVPLTFCHLGSPGLSDFSQLGCFREGRKGSVLQCSWETHSPPPLLPFVPLLLRFTLHKYAEVRPGAQILQAGTTRKCSGGPAR